jgi:hypothetical protein
MYGKRRQLDDALDEILGATRIILLGAEALTAVLKTLSGLHVSSPGKTSHPQSNYNNGELLL